MFTLSRLRRHYYCTSYQAFNGGSQEFSLVIVSDVAPFSCIIAVSGQSRRFNESGCAANVGLQQPVQRELQIGAPCPMNPSFPSQIRGQRFTDALRHAALVSPFSAPLCGFLVIR